MFMLVNSVQKYPRNKNANYCLSPLAMSLCEMVLVPFLRTCWGKNVTVKMAKIKCMQVLNNFQYYWPYLIL